MTTQVIDAATFAFPASVHHLMPKYEDIPEEFKIWNSRNKWNNLFSDWFYLGLNSLEEPKHEHKEAACAYLMSLWFKDAKWEVKK